MKTTIEISDNLLRRAKTVARRQGITLRALAEEGLEQALARHEAGTAVKVRPVVVDGEGVSPEFAGAAWERLRSAAYEGRGA
jgi:hypothetical protein